MKEKRRIFKKNKSCIREILVTAIIKAIIDFFNPKITKLEKISGRICF